MKIPNTATSSSQQMISLARIVSEDSQLVVTAVNLLDKSSKDS